MAKNKRRARKDSYLSKRRQKNKRFLGIALALLVISSLGFLYLNSSMNKENEAMNKDIISSQKKLEDMKTEIKGLKEDYEMRNTDQFKEKVAKEKLGMVKKGEEKSEEKNIIKPVKNPNQENQPTDLNSDKQANPNGGEKETTNNNQDEKPILDTEIKPDANENGR